MPLAKANDFYINLNQPNLGKYNKCALYTSALLKLSKHCILKCERIKYSVDSLYNIRRRCFLYNIVS